MVDKSQIKIIEGKYSLHNSNNVYPCSIFTYYDDENKFLWYGVKGLYKIYFTTNKKELKTGELIEIMGSRRGFYGYINEEVDINTIEEFCERLSDEIMRMSPGFETTINPFEISELESLIYEEEKKRKEERLSLKNDNPELKFYLKIIKGRHEPQQFKDPEEQDRYNKNLDYELLTCSLNNSQTKEGVIKNNYYNMNLTWFCFKGSKYVHLTPDKIENNTDVSYISSRNFLESEKTINTLDELKNIVLRGINEENEKFKRLKVYSPTCRFDFGKYEDWKLIEVIKIDPNYINWCVIHKEDFIYTSNIDFFRTFKDFSLSQIGDRNNEKKSKKNQEIYTQQMSSQRFTNRGKSYISRWVSRKDVFDSITDGQYGSYNDFNGDFDSLKDRMGL
jgi:hypothetical protein